MTTRGKEPQTITCGCVLVLFCTLMSVLLALVAVTSGLEPNVMIQWECRATGCSTWSVVQAASSWMLAQGKDGPRQVSDHAFLAALSHVEIAGVPFSFCHRRTEKAMCLTDWIKHVCLGLECIGPCENTRFGDVLEFNERHRDILDAGSNAANHSIDAEGSIPCRRSA